MDKRDEIDHWRRVMFRWCSTFSLSQDAVDRLAKCQGEIAGFLEGTPSDEDAHIFLVRLRARIAEIREGALRG